MIKPLRIYRSDRGVWHAEINQAGVVKWFSLHTKNEEAAKEKWRQYVAKIVEYTTKNQR